MPEDAKRVTYAGQPVSARTWDEAAWTASAPEVLRRLEWSWAVAGDGARCAGWCSSWAKQALDIAGALVGLAAYLPLLLVAAAAIRLTSPGPVLYSQLRVGRNARMFRIWKLRTMYVNGEEILRAHPEALEEFLRTRKVLNDPRVTPVGRLLRRFSIDEAPQFWNLLKGDMSLVGPRPVVEEEIPFYGDRFVFYSGVRPGLTGMWQIMGRSETGYSQRAQLDEHYARHASFRLDLMILMRTVAVVAGGRGAW